MKTILYAVAAIVGLVLLVPTGGNSEALDFLKYAFYIGCAIWLVRDFLKAGK